MISDEERRILQADEVNQAVSEAVKALDALRSQGKLSDEALVVVDRLRKVVRAPSLLYRIYPALSGETRLMETWQEGAWSPAMPD